MRRRSVRRLLSVRGHISKTKQVWPVVIIERYIEVGTAHFVGAIRSSPDAAPVEIFWFQIKTRISLLRKEAGPPLASCSTCWRQPEVLSMRYLLAIAKFLVSITAAQTKQLHRWSRDTFFVLDLYISINDIRCRFGLAVTRWSQST